MIDISPGIEHVAQFTVKDTHLTPHFARPEIRVLATPALLAMIEECCIQAIDPMLPEGEITVGYLVDFRHLEPSVEGAQVAVHASVVAFDDRKVTINVEVTDLDRTVAKGRHIRAIANVASFNGC